MVCAWATCVFLWTSRTVPPGGCRSICGRVVQAANHQGFLFCFYFSLLFFFLLSFASHPFVFIAASPGLYILVILGTHLSLPRCCQALSCPLDMMIILSQPSMGPLIHSPTHPPSHPSIQPATIHPSILMDSNRTGWFSSAKFSRIPVCQALCREPVVPNLINQEAA